MTEGGVDAGVAAWLDYGGGFTATFECSFEAHERQQLELVGTEATVRIGRAFTPGPDDTSITVRHADGRVETVEHGGGNSYRGMVDHVAAVLRGEAEPARTLDDVLDVATLIDRCKVVAAGG
jgi:predicted dehydrogenase